MKRTLLTFVSLTSLAFSAAAAEEGFKSIFNGKDLTGWEGNAKLWSVQDGAITGKTGNEGDTKIKHNTFLVWKAGTLANFELRLQYKIIGGNSGIQYRSKVMQQGEFGPIVGGYQADFEAGKTFSGILYEERGRGILAQRGQKTVIKEVDGKHKVEVVGTLGKSEEIQAKIRNEDWNDYVIIANGNHLQHFINSVQTVDVVDEQESKAAKDGILALQIHQGPAMTVQFRDIRIKELGKKASFDGTWKVIAGTIDGNAAGEDFLNSVSVTIDGKNYRSIIGGETDSGSFTVDDAKSPNAMDIRPANNPDRIIPAIYELTGDTLRVCYATKGARPTEFKSEADSGVVLFTYKRGK
jgi:uncharacterized protein (TIGR03067 family)